MGFKYEKPRTMVVNIIIGVFIGHLVGAGVGLLFGFICFLLVGSLGINKFSNLPGYIFLLVLFLSGFVAGPVAVLTTKTKKYEGLIVGTCGGAVGLWVGVIFIFFDDGRGWSLFFALPSAVGGLLGSWLYLVVQQRVHLDKHDNYLKNNWNKWQESLENDFPFEAIVESEFERGIFQKGERVMVVGVVWADERHGLMVECHGNEKQGDFPLRDLLVSEEESMVAKHVTDYKRAYFLLQRESGEFNHAENKGMIAEDPFE